MSIPQKCKIDGCERTGRVDGKGRVYLSKGMCNAHYLRLKRHGSPLLGKEQRNMHGKSNHELYITYRKMRQRCLNPKSDSFRYYGGRGIKICDRWINSFENFLDDMGERPEGMTLDRIDVNGNYEPSNCRWATAKEQMNNTRYNRVITINGVTMSLAMWSDEYGVSATTIYGRLKRGWSLEQAITHPLMGQGRKRKTAENDGSP